MAQGGDFTRFDGTGGYSVYGKKFADESFELEHTVGGLLSMANSGKDSNGSQFFITFKPTPHLNGKHVVFGQVAGGMSTVKAMEKLGSQSGKPQKRVEVTNCRAEELTASDFQ